MVQLWYLLVSGLAFLDFITEMADMIRSRSESFSVTFSTGSEFKSFFSVAPDCDVTEMLEIPDCDVIEMLETMGDKSTGASSNDVDTKLPSLLGV